MPGLAERLEITRGFVAGYEAGEISHLQLFEHVPAITAELGTEDDVEFAIHVYEIIRPVEAVAYKLRGQQVVKDDPIDTLVQDAFSLRWEIQRRLVKANALIAQNPLEEIGKIFLEDKLTWALQVLNEFLPAWGYMPRDESS